MLTSLKDCLNWIPNNFLQLNSDKTEILVIGLQHLTNQILPFTSSFDLSDLNKSVANNLGVWFDSDLCFALHTTFFIILGTFLTQNLASKFLT